MRLFARRKANRQHKLPRVPLEPLKPEDAQNRAAGLILGIRVKNGWSQKQLAYKLGVSVRTVSRWESGETEPNARDLYLFQAILRATKKPPAAKPGADLIN